MGLAVALTAADYRQQAQALLPHGPAWPTDADAYTTRLLDGLAAEFARVDARAQRLVDEADPRSTLELLADWERVAGLPDGCVSSAGTDLSTTQRRAALLGRLTMLGAQSVAYYVALAAGLGYAITITEFAAFDVDGSVDDALYGWEWGSAWQVNGLTNTVVDITVDDTADDAIASWSNVVLQCVLNRFKPAHTTVLFNYT